MWVDGCQSTSDALGYSRLSRLHAADSERYSRRQLSADCTTHSQLLKSWSRQTWSRQANVVVVSHASIQYAEMVSYNTQKWSETVKGGGGGVEGGGGGEEEPLLSAKEVVFVRVGRQRRTPNCGEGEGDQSFLSSLARSSWNNRHVRLEYNAM